MPARVRAAGTGPGSVRVIFDGQSLCYSPGDPGPWQLDGGGGWSWPWRLMRGRPEPWFRPAISGATFDQLINLAPGVEARLWSLFKAETNILILAEGTSDCNAGMSAPDLYAAHADYALAARANGCQYVIGCDLIGSTAFSAGEQTARGTFNGLLADDDEDAFNGGVAGIDAAFVAAYGASYWTNPAVLWDGVHQLGPANIVWANTVAPLLDALLV